MKGKENRSDEAALAAFRSEFPVTENCVYLDHSGVAPLSLRVARAIERFLAEAVGAGARHYLDWTERVAKVRRSCAALLNCRSDEIAFVKNTSHGLSLVAEGLDWKPGENVLIYEKEFPSNIFPWRHLERRGVEVRVVPSRDGRIDLADIEGLIDSRTRVVALSAVQFANGFRLDLPAVGALCRERGVLFCVDAIQCLGAFPLDPGACKIDFLAADAHKWLLGPEGIGVFYCRSGLAERLAPVLTGWKSVQQELAFDHPEFTLKTDALRFEEGTLNLMGIFGLGAATDLLREAGVERIAERILDLGDLVIREARAAGYTVLTPEKREERGGNVTFAGAFDPVAMREKLRSQNILVSARGGGIRVSPHFYNTEEEVRQVFRAMAG